MWHLKKKLDTLNIAVHVKHNTFKGGKKLKTLLLWQFVLQILQNSFSSFIQHSSSNAETSKETLSVSYSVSALLGT